MSTSAPSTKPRLPQNNSPPPSSWPLVLSALLASKDSDPMVLDGALATYLESLGADISTSLWSASILLSAPQLIHRTHLDYYRAGANIVITASYQASLPGLIQHLKISEDEAQGIIKKSVELARAARDDYLTSLDGEARKRKEGKLLVAGSVGPYGAFSADGSEYRGDYSLPKEAMKAFHRGRIQALLSVGVDVLACETMPSFPEIHALLSLLNEEFPGTEAWFSFTLKDSEHISDGTSLEDVVKALEGEEKVVAVGVNCVRDELALGALRTLKQLTQKALIVYPNSGEQWNAESRGWYGKRNGGMQLAERTMGWWDTGAKIIGGCCRTTPDDIRTIAQTLDTISK